ncbi:DEAD/DEAH box helicase [Enterococcus sp. C1]|uniref:DEAD/DEAH box helicase family protein n=1 Tax=unclassified Enterococcus TaxID=2608891 RepID=UPI000271E140|nr:DEAD/DEAH box helicase family protein [Enterococcus sp. C1]EJF51011.1 DEAD/DEAH box helicase [Enterococcus sp. C1]
MVDFNEKMGIGKIILETDPEKIYDTLDRSTEKGPLRPEQIEILNKWYSERSNDENTILKLNTGKGKTIIGLLILLSKMNSLNKPVLYMCPNNFLVEQTVAQAKQFGIKTCTIGTDRQLPMEYINAESILVITSQYMFHGYSKFEDDRFSTDCGAIVIDDSHAVIDNIRQSMKFLITKNKSELVYNKFLSLFEEPMKKQGLGTFEDIKNDSDNDDSYIYVPYWAWKDSIEQVTNILSQNKDYNEIKYTWPILKDSLVDADCYISSSSIEIVPYILPIEKFTTYSNADHKIYMSATISEDSILIKELGLEQQVVKNPLTLDLEDWSGEKMMITPSNISDQLDRSKIVEYFGKPTEKNKKVGKVVLTPSFLRTKDWEAYGSRILDSNNLSAGIQYLSQESKPLSIVFANRYDGIDLPDDLCRILIIDSLPKFESLEDKYISDVLPDSTLMSMRKIQKIEQGIGRSVRGEKDYSAIVFIGNDLISFMGSKKNREYFSRYTKQQIRIGELISQFGKEDLENGKVKYPINVLFNLLNQLLDRDVGWKKFYEAQMNETPTEIVDISNMDRLTKERKFMEEYSKGNVEKALMLVQEYIDSYCHDELERGYYLQVKAKYQYKNSHSESIKIQNVAYQKNNALLAYTDSIKVEQITGQSFSQRSENIKDKLCEIGCKDELLLVMKELQSKLQFGDDSERFEQGINLLGELLGFETQRPEKDYKQGPDNLWAVAPNDYFIIECKNKVLLSRKHINKSESGQMNNSIAWFNRKYGNSNHTNFMIVGTKYYDAAGGFNEDVKIIRKNKFKKLLNNVMNFLKEFQNENFEDIASSKISELLTIHNLNIIDLKQEYFEEARPYQK